MHDHFSNASENTKHMIQYEFVNIESQSIPTKEPQHR